MSYTITYQHRTDFMHTMTIRAESKEQAIRRSSPASPRLPGTLNQRHTHRRIDTNLLNPTDMKRGYVYKDTQGRNCHTWADFGENLHDTVTYWMRTGEGQPKEITYQQYRNRVKKSLAMFRKLYKELQTH